MLDRCYHMLLARSLCVNQKTNEASDLTLSVVLRLKLHQSRVEVQVRPPEVLIQ
jgi:hypothetical protein